MTLAFALICGTLAAFLVAATAHGYATHGASARHRRAFTVVAGVLAAAGLGLLAAGVVPAGVAGIALAVEAFVCSAVFAGSEPPPDDSDDGGPPGGGSGRKPEDPTGGDGIDWDRFERDFREYAQRRQGGNRVRRLVG
jgi:hypothetical protein